MKINKALKVKNRLAGEIARLQEILGRENSRRNDNPSKVNPEEIFKALNVTLSNLIYIKAALASASANISPKLAELAERKNRVNFLNSLPTREGEEVAFIGRDQEKMTYTWASFINRQSVDNLVASEQNVINNLQDDIDIYNANTEIPEPQSALTSKTE